MSDDLSPLARVVMEVVQRNGGTLQCTQWAHNTPLKVCPDCAEEIAQRVIGEWKRWVVTQHKDDNGYRGLW